MNCILREFIQNKDIEIKTGPFGTQLKAAEYVKEGTVKTAKINPRFLSYYFLTPKHRAFMVGMCSHGTTMASLNQKILEMIEISLPEREVQDKIVSVLSVIDEKIKSNARINDNLPYAMSQAKQRRYQPSGACSRKAAYRHCFIGRMPDSSRLSRERSLAAKNLFS